MGKTWNTRRRGDEKDFLRSLRKGMTVYVINEPSHFVPGVYRPRTYSDHKVTGKHPIFGSWEIGNNIDAKGFFRAYGTVYEQPPAGFEHFSYDGDSRFAPFAPGDAYDRRLDDQELKEMQYRVDEANDRRAADQKAKRKWF